MTLKILVKKKEEEACENGNLLWKDFFHNETINRQITRFAFTEKKPLVKITMKKRT